MNRPGTAILHPRRTRARLLGLAAMALFAVHAGYEIAIGEPETLLWACHLGTLAVGLGLLLDWPTWNGIGLLWLTLGVPLWLNEMAAHGGYQPTSPLTHLGGLLIGLAGTRFVGLPRGVWWKAVASLYLLHLVTRWVTPAEKNINLAFRVWTGWEAEFPSYPVYILSIIALCCGLFACIEAALCRTGFARRAPEQPVPEHPKQNGRAGHEE